MFSSNPASTPKTRNQYVNQRATLQSNVENFQKNLQPTYEHPIHNPGGPSLIRRLSFQQYNRNPEYIEPPSPVGGLVNGRTRGNYPSAPHERPLAEEVLEIYENFHGPISKPPSPKQTSNGLSALNNYNKKFRNKSYKSK